MNSRPLKLIKQWSIDLADFEYALYKERKADLPAEHSCYSCFDGWKKQRMACPFNKDTLKCIGTGDEKWAERTAKHFNITIEKE